MVHALKEIRRVLVPSGILVDFRPIGTSWPLEIVSAGRRRLVARVDRAEHIRDDAVCEQALAQAVQEEWLVPEREQTFTFWAHWNTAAEVSAPVDIPDAVSAEAQSLLDQIGPNARIGIRFENIIAGYRKQRPVPGTGDRIGRGDQGLQAGKAGEESPCNTS